MQNIHQERILILDFGSQYTQLIARRVREQGVYCELHAADMSPEAIQQFSPNGIILSGGPNTVTLADTQRIPEIVFELNCPVLGICYGMQAMALQQGGQVSASDKREFGHANVTLKANCALFEGIEDDIAQEGRAVLKVWMSHGDQVTQLPDTFECVAQSENAHIAAMMHHTKPWYGVQFHPEVTHTKQGARILNRFVRDICGCHGLWTPDNIINDAVNTIQKQVGTDNVLLGLSGGVDSSVVAALMHKAIGKQLTCVFIDNGLLRHGEAEQVVATFGEHFGMQLVHVDARDAFLSALAGVSDPEAKRKVIGRVFIEQFDAQAKKLEGVKWLAQGTIYPDVIESAGAKSGKAHVIKSHHNVGGLPEEMALQLVEPLRELFKDEVRNIGLSLGLPAHLIHRHPFPGPGLAVRVLGEIKREYLPILRQADHIYLEELSKHDLYDTVSQAFAVFLPVKSVGVVGDARQYEYVIALRAVETIDFMTAKFSHLAWDFLQHVANRIMNEVSGVARVTYDISSKPPATIEWE